MIEVLFGDSEAASMKAAKNKIVLGKADGPTSVLIAGKKKNADGWKARPMRLFVLGLCWILAI